MSVIRAHWWWWGSHNGGEEGAITTNSGSSSCSWTTLALQTLSSLFIYSGCISFSLFFLFLPLPFSSLPSLSFSPSFFLSLLPSLLVNCPTRQSLFLFIVSLHWLSSWQWWPSMRGCRLYLPIWGPGMGNLSQFFFANLTNFMSPYGEFRCCHRVFGVFRYQMHVFWGPMGSRKFSQFMKTQKTAFYVA